MMSEKKWMQMFGHMLDSIPPVKHEVSPEIIWPEKGYEYIGLRDHRAYVIKYRNKQNDFIRARRKDGKRFEAYLPERFWEFFKKGKKIIKNEDTPGNPAL